MRKGVSHIGVGHVGVVYPRAQIIDYTWFTYYLEVGHKTRKPIPISPILNIFHPYTFDLWVGLAIAVVLSSAIFALSAAIGPLSKEFLWFDFAIMPLSMLMESSMTELTFYKRIKKTSNGFIMLATWVVATFFFVKAYESNLLASLLAKVYEKPIDSFQDMLDSGRPVYYTRGSTVVRVLQVNKTEKASSFKHRRALKLCPQCVPKLYPMRPQSVPNAYPMRPQCVSNGSPMRPKFVPKASPKRTQCVLKVSPKRSQWIPDASQSVPKTSPMHPQSVPYAPQMLKHSKL